MESAQLFRRAKINISFVWPPAMFFISKFKDPDAKYYEISALSYISGA